MSVTLTRVPNFDDVYGRTYVRTFDVQLDSSYPLTNGYVIQAADVGLKAFKGAKVIGSNKAGGAVLPVLDFSIDATHNLGIAPSSVAFRVFAPTGGGTAASSLAAPSVAEGAITNGAISIAASTATPASGSTAVTSTSAQPAIPVTFGAITQATSTIASGGLTAGIGKEFANTTDLSTLFFRVEFSGF